MRTIQNIAANFTVVCEWMGIPATQVCTQIGITKTYLYTAKCTNAMGTVERTLKLCNWCRVPIDEVVFKDFTHMAPGEWKRLKKDYDIKNRPRMDDQLRDIAEIYGVSVQSLCEAIELSPQWAENARRTKTNPKMETAYIAAENLGISIEELLFGDFRKDKERWISKLSSLEFY